MALSFKELKKSRQESLQKLSEQLDKMSKPSRKEDENSDIFWSPTTGPDGNGFAIVRLLSEPKGEDMPWVQKFSHGFKNPKTGAWYIENSLTTLGQKDPCGEYNSWLWNQGPAGQDQARSQKRRLTYFANVYVIKDAAKPENEGKVLVWRFGKKIFEKIMNQIKPPFEGETPCDPFDLWNGKNLKVRVKTIVVREGDQERKYPNFDNSEWDAQGPLFKEDSKIEDVWNSAHSLQQFVAPTEFKTYEELEATLTRVMGMEETGLPSSKVNKSKSYVEKISPDSTPRRKSPKIPEKQISETPPWDEDHTEDSEDLRKLFEELKAD